MSYATLMIKKMDMLEKIFNGEINLAETYCCDSISYLEALKEIQQLRKKITCCMTKDEIIQLEDYDDCFRITATEDAKMYFKIGFCLALQLQEDLSFVKNKYFPKD